jgi:hypothetical protein
MNHSIFKESHLPIICTSDKQSKNLLMHVSDNNVDSKYKYKINTYDEFVRRFNIYTNDIFTTDEQPDKGSSSYRAGNGKIFNFKKLNMYITGSVMVPCSGVNPLESLFTDTKSYIDYIYPYNTTDIDIAFSGDIESEFENNVNIVFEHCRSKNPNATLHLVDKGYDFKYSIKIPGMRHIEIYRVKDNIVALIHRFHLCCVRQFFDGSNVFMLSECVNAMMTGINTSYRYMANNTNPMFCILKYAKRGYTTVLNTKERHSILKYINDKDSAWLKEFTDNRLDKSLSTSGADKQIVASSDGFENAQKIEDFDKSSLVLIKSNNVFGSFSPQHRFFRYHGKLIDKFIYPETNLTNNIEEQKEETINLPDIRVEIDNKNVPDIKYNHLSISDGNNFITNKN